MILKTELKQELLMLRSGSLGNTDLSFLSFLVKEDLLSEKAYKIFKKEEAERKGKVLKQGKLSYAIQKSREERNV